MQVNARDLRSGLVRKRTKAVDKEARAAAEARNAERPLPVAPAAEAYAQALQLLLMARGCLPISLPRGGGAPSAVVLTALVARSALAYPWLTCVSSPTVIAHHRRSVRRSGRGSARPRT